MDPAHKRRFKDTVYDLFAGVAQAMSSGRRLEILDLLSQADYSVEWIADACDLTVANTSRHLQILRAAGLVTARRDGVRRIYRLADPSAYSLCAAVREYAEARLPEIDQVVGSYLDDRGSLSVIDAGELRERLAAGDVVLLDVRPRVEFDAGHIPRARCMPLDELDERAAELPPEREVVAYCRGRYCVFAHEAVRRLRELGLRARRFEGNARDWGRSRKAG